MKDLIGLFNECVEEVLDCGIEIGDIRDVTVNTRAKTRFGQTKLRYDAYGERYFTINISNEILVDRVPDRETKNTIIHEILHTVEGCFNHGKTWKYYASIVNEKYGYHVSRCSSYQSFGLESPASRDYRYKIICSECGKTYFRKRWSNVCANPKGYNCGVCGANKLRVVSADDAVQVLRAW